MGRPRTRRALIAVCATALLAGCGGDGSKVFGETAEPCSPVLSQRDQGAVDDGAACFISEVSAGNPVVWDVMSWTDEGDPIPIRYEFDGDKVTITTDSTRDTYGSGDVIRERCDSVVGGSGLPLGVDCTSVPGDGFKSKSLPT